MADCQDCKGKGIVPLFTSLAKCEACKGYGSVAPLSTKEKQRIIREFLKTPEGRAKLAASLTEPRRNRVDYNAITRTTFREKLAA